jgi:hypothetical protein
MKEMNYMLTISPLKKPFNAFIAVLTSNGTNNIPTGLSYSGKHIQEENCA